MARREKVKGKYVVDARHNSLISHKEWASFEMSVLVVFARLRVVMSCTVYLLQTTHTNT